MPHDTNLCDLEFALKKKMKIICKVGSNCWLLAWHDFYARSYTLISKCMAFYDVIIFFFFWAN